MKLGYSEFSFGYAFTENLIRSSGNNPQNAPRFLNLVEEGKLGYDVCIDLPACAMFFQFKLPHRMERKTADEIKNHSGGHDLCVEFFRMYLMRCGTSKQHEHLINLEVENPGRVFYATPLMRDLKSFNSAYVKKAVHLETAFFSPCDIGPLPDDKEHKVSYKANSKHGWFFSEPKKIDLYRFEQLHRRISSEIEERRNQETTIRDEINATMKKLRELVSPTLLDAEERIQKSMRRRIEDSLELQRKDKSKQSGEIESDRDDHVELLTDLLLAREYCRIGLGIEMVIAQPRS